MRKHLIGTFRTRAFRLRAWKFLNAIVAVVTIANVSLVGALAPTTVNATETPEICAGGYVGASTNGAITATVSNPFNVYVQDNSDAVFNSTGDHKFGGFGLALPTGAEVDGIEVCVRAHRTSGSGDKDLDIYLTEDGSNWGSTSRGADNFGSSYETEYPGASNDLWGRSNWTASELADGNFFVRVRNDFSFGNVGVDYVGVKVFYHVDKGELKVQKKLDSDGNGSFETVNPASFKWGLDGGAVTRTMGSEVDVTIGDHEVTENSVDGYHLVGWYVDDNGSCAEPQGTTLPASTTISSKHDDDVVTFCNAKDEEKEPVTINAWKIVCTDEADLPNWGASGGPDITSTTAQNWVNSHESCSLVSGWNFQWGPESATNPGDNTGVAGAPWTTFGPTNGSGMTTATIDDYQDGLIWVREVWQNGYIPFTMSQNYDNSNDVSAEMYCHTDVINYDNYDWIAGIQPGGTYNCVGWNVAARQPQGTLVVHKQLDADGNGSYETTVTDDVLGFAWNLDDEDPWKTFGTSLNLAPGDYDVVEKNVAGYHMVGWTYGNSDGDICGEAKLGGGNPEVDVVDQQETHITFCNQVNGEIGGTKYYDWDRDGQTDENDQVISEWEITLHRLYAEGSSLAGTVNTDANGHYSFTNLEPGNYLVCEYLPNGWAPTGTGFWTEAGWCQEASIGGTYDFHNYRTGVIHGLKFNDMNGDGFWNEDIAALSGWTIFIDEDADGILDDGEQSTQTNGSEGYEFTDLVPGTYSICEVQQSGWMQTYPQNDGTAICHSVTVNTEGPNTCFNLQDNVSALTVQGLDGPMCNFGNQEQATVTVLKNVDENGDGDTTDPNETGSTAWTWDVNAGNQNHATGSTQTVAPGSITINEDAKDGYSFVSVVCDVNQDPFEVTPGESVSFETFAGGNYTCTFTNKKIVTTINLVKDGPATVNAGDNITYTLNWSVAGNTAATNATITDPVPANTTFVSADNGGTLQGNVVVWNLGTKNPGDSGAVTLVVKSNSPVTNGTLVTNTGTFDTDQTDPKLDDANTTLHFTPPPTPQVLGAATEPSLTITKSVNKDTAKPGDILMYTITITSTGTGDAESVIVTDTLPDDFSFTEGSGKTRTWDLGTLAPGQSSVMNVDVRVESDAVKGDYINVATVDADGVDQKQASVTVAVSTPQVLGLATTGSSALDYFVFALGTFLAAFGLVGLKLRRTTPIRVRK